MELVLNIPENDHNYQILKYFLKQNYNHLVNKYDKFSELKGTVLSDSNLKKLYELSRLTEENIKYLIELYPKFELPKKYYIRCGRINSEPQSTIKIGHDVTDITTSCSKCLHSTGKSIYNSNIQYSCYWKGKNNCYILIPKRKLYFLKVDDNGFCSRKDLYYTITNLVLGVDIRNKNIQNIYGKNNVTKVNGVFRNNIKWYPKYSLGQEIIRFYLSDYVIHSDNPMISGVVFCDEFNINANKIMITKEYLFLNPKDANIFMLNSIENCVSNIKKFSEILYNLTNCPNNNTEDQ